MVLALPLFLWDLKVGAPGYGRIGLYGTTYGTYSTIIRGGGLSYFNSGNQYVFGQTTAVFSTDLFDVVGNATYPDPINAYTSEAASTAAIYGESTAAGGTGIWGSATTDANSWGVFGSSSTGIGVLGYGGGIGIYGTNNTNTGFGGRFINTNATGTAIICSGNNLIPTYLTSGTGGAFTGDPYGIAAFKNGDLSDGEGAGYFIASTTSNVGVAVAYRLGGTNYKIVNIGAFGGAVSTDVWGLTNDTNDRKIMFCPEAPEILFQDYGQGKLNEGKAHIELDPIFSRNIVVNDEHPLRVFIQLEGDCNGVYVTNKTKSGFDVIELQNGNSNIKFTWFVTANRADYVNPITNILISKHEGVRFPQAPNPEKSVKVKTDKKIEEK